MDSSQQEAPYHVRMDSEDALKLVKQGASLLLLDVPASTSFGIDQQVCESGSSVPPLSSAISFLAVHNSHNVLWIADVRCGAKF